LSETREHDLRIERLLAEAEAATGPVAWPRVEALVTALVDLYGRGLERIVAHARAAAPDADLDARFAADELVASLLVLHDLHPVPVETRIARALDRLHDELPDAATLSLVGVENGTAMLRAAEGARPPPTNVVARAVELEAPELTGLRVVGEEPQKQDRSLVPAERLRHRGGAS
jgi:hypothetical protein